MKKTFLVAAVAAVFSTAAFANDHVDYDYVQGSYLQNDDVVDATGYDFEASTKIADDFYVKVNYGQAEADDYDVEADGLALTFGYAQELSSDTDMIFEIGYMDQEVDAYGSSYSDDAMIYGVGVRTAALADNTELSVVYEHYDFDSGSDGAFGAEFFYKFTNEFAAGVQLLDDGDTLGLAARYTF